MIDFDRHYGTVVTSVSWVSGLTQENVYMLLVRDDQNGIESWTFTRLREDEAVAPVNTAWLTFAPGHAWGLIE